jgi:hypothetical protein
MDDNPYKAPEAKQSPRKRRMRGIFSLLGSCIGGFCGWLWWKLEFSEPPQLPDIPQTSAIELMFPCMAFGLMVGSFADWYFFGRRTDGR